MKRFLCVAMLAGSSVAFAAGETPSFFTELAILMMSSSLIAFLGFRIGLIPILGFLLAGVLIGPNALGLVQNPELIDAAAEVGVILLLFTIGIEFSLETLRRISRLIFIGGGLQVSLTILVTTSILLAFGIDWRTGVYTGFLVALSSTAIVMKLLADRNATSGEAGQTALGILIFQDLAVVAMVLLIPLLGSPSAGGEDGNSLLQLLWALAKAGGIIVLVLVLARRVMPKVLEAVARTCSPEIFLLAIVGICFGTAYLTSLAGVSLSLGAFLAGLLVSESRFGQQAFSEILPLQILFSAAFFVSVGLLLDVGFLFTHLPMVLAALLAIILLKALITGFGIKVLGYPTSTAITSGLLLTQIGEFSFVLERTGRELGLSPAGFGEDGAQTFIAATVLLMGATPFLANLGERLGDRFANKNILHTINENEIPKELAESFASLTDHVIIAGYGMGGQNLAAALHEAHVPFAIATLSPTGASQAETSGHKVVRGDYTKGHILNLVGIGRAKAMVIPDDGASMAHRISSVARALNPNIPIIATTPYHASSHELKQAGASFVVAADKAANDLLVTKILHHYSVAENRIESYLERLSDVVTTGTNVIELTEKQLHQTKCNHTNQVNAVVPSAQGCEECLKLGDTWVHLRICMICGHVGCCDSSKNKHAAQHFRETGHPIMRSIEKGEAWAWCYVDKVTLEA
ncbi:MAG: cation:proton antiporter [Trueperaceae bacterium]